MRNSLLENANRFMGKSVYEQAEFEAKAKMEEMEDDVEVTEEEELEAPIMSDEEGGEIEAEEGGDEELEDGEEETPLMPVASAIRAIQMALNGEVESAEEALDMVQDMEAEDSEDEEMEYSDEEGEDDVEEGCNKVVEGEDDELAPDVDDKPIDKKNLPKDFDDLSGIEEEEVEEKTYGENHSRFLKFSQRYL